MAINCLDDPHEIFSIPEVAIRKVAAMILPIRMGDTWHQEDGRPMTNEEARNTGDLLCPLGHHNWMTRIHHDNFQTYAANDDPAHMARAREKVTRH